MDEQARARASDPATSHAAAAKVNVTQREREILATLHAGDPLGMTASEIALTLGVSRDVVSPRMKAIVAKQYVAGQGTRGGQIIYRLTAPGITLFA